MDARQLGGAHQVQIQEEPTIYRVKLQVELCVASSEYPEQIESLVQETLYEGLDTTCEIRDVDAQLYALEKYDIHVQAKDIREDRHE